MNPMTTGTIEDFIENQLGKDIFIKEANEYKRDIDSIRQYVEQGAQFLHIIEKIPYAEAFEEVRANIRPDGQYPMLNPRVKFVDKDENEDRFVNETSMMAYMHSVVSNKEAMAATFTAYCHPDKIRSYHVDYIDTGVKKRKGVKKLQFKAQQEMEYSPEAALTYIFTNNQQNNIKKGLNSISGATSIPSTPLYMPTIHSTLTSNCRMTSGYGNANNEKLLSGNRHYHNANVTLNNLVALTTRIDEKLIAEVIAKYKLYVPTAEQLHEYILRSSRQYWMWKEQEAIIFEFLSKCSEVQRASIAFNYDMYAMAKFNSDFMRGFIGGLAKTCQPITDMSIDTAKDIIYGAGEDVRNLAIQINSHLLKGLKLEDYAITETALLVAACIVNVYKVLADYSDYIVAFCKTQHVPASLAFFPSSIRHCVVMSDTDSTIFTVQDWVNWYCGEYKVDDESNSIFAVMVFLSISTLRNILAQMSANLGVIPERIWQIAMKNEFKFERFVAMLHTKHYKASITYQEGNVLGKIKTETKGVHLRNSSSPQFIIDKCDELMQKAYNFDGTTPMVSVTELLKEVADIERKVIRSVDEGDVEFYRTRKVKDSDTYKDGEDATMYQKYVFWNATFGHFYGEAPPPPYAIVDIKLDIKNKTDMKAWLSSMENRELARLIEMELKNQGKTKMSTIGVPYENFIGKPIPKEIIPFVAKRDLIANICSPFYYMFETFGMSFLDKNVTKLISDSF